MSAQRSLPLRCRGGPPLGSARIAFTLVCCALRPFGSCDGAVGPADTGAPPGAFGDGSDELSAPGPKAASGATCPGPKAEALACEARTAGAAASAVPTPDVAAAKAPRSHKQRSLLQKAQVVTLVEDPRLGEERLPRQRSLVQNAQAVTMVEDAGLGVESLPSGNGKAGGSAPGNTSGHAAPADATWAAPDVFYSAGMAVFHRLRFTQLGAQLRAQLREPTPAFALLAFALSLTVVGMLLAFVASSFRERQDGATGRHLQAYRASSLALPHPWETPASIDQAWHVDQYPVLSCSPTSVDLGSATSLGPTPRT